MKLFLNNEDIHWFTWLLVMQGGMQGLWSRSPYKNTGYGEAKKEYPQGHR